MSDNNEQNQTDQDNQPNRLELPEAMMEHCRATLERKHNSMAHMTQDIIRSIMGWEQTGHLQVAQVHVLYDDSILIIDNHGRGHLSDLVAPDLSDLMAMVFETHTFTDAERTELGNFIWQELDTTWKIGTDCPSSNVGDAATAIEQARQFLAQRMGVDAHEIQVSAPDGVEPGSELNVQDFLASHGINVGDPDGRHAQGHPINEEEEGGDFNPVLGTNANANNS